MSQSSNLWLKCWLDMPQGSISNFCPNVFIVVRYPCVKSNYQLSVRQENENLLMTALQWVLLSSRMALQFSKLPLLLLLLDRECILSFTEGPPILHPCLFTWRHVMRQEGSSGQFFTNSPFHTAMVLVLALVWISGLRISVHSSKWAHLHSWTKVPKSDIAIDYVMHKTLACQYKKTVSVFNVTY